MPRPAIIKISKIHRTPKQRQVKIDLEEIKKEHEKTEEAVAEMTQTMDSLPTPPDSDLSAVLSDKLGQLLVAVQTNQVSIERLTEIVNQGVIQDRETAEILRNFARISIKNELIFHYGLTEILTGPLGFIKERLTAVNGDLCLDGTKIENVVWFKKVIQHKPWVVFSGEYVVDCYHCHNTYDLVNANESHTYITCQNCQKRTPFCTQALGAKCSHCSLVMIVGIGLTTDMDCLSCKQRFNPWEIPENELIETPRRK